LFGQETLTKTLLQQKQPSIKQGLLVAKKQVLTTIIISALLFSGVAGLEIVRIARANPIGNVPVPYIGISYPPYLPNRYENTTVNLQIYANMFIDSPPLNSISYRLDGGPRVHIDNFTVKNTKNYFGIDKFDYKSYKANTTLENLSEGNHTIIAYAGDMSTSRTFTVNSHFAVTEINVLSPTNQTYANTVPLVFTVNGEIKEAHYYMYRGYDAVFEGSFSGNTTLDNLSTGSYVMHIYVTTEKGEATTSTFFNVLNNNYSVDSRIYAMFMIPVIMVGVGLGLLLLFKKRKH
jgi:hypothetical protein